MILSFLSLDLLIFLNFDNEISFVFFIDYFLFFNFWFWLDILSRLKPKIRFEAKIWIKKWNW